VPGLCLDVAQTCFADCLEDGQALYADLGRPEERTGRFAEGLAAAGATSSFAVPLRAGERTLGVLQSVCFRPAGFTAEQVQLFHLVADLLGPAISNCRLFDQLRSAYDDLHLTQQRLIQAEKMRALGELAGGMAHEFNNSLCGTLGFLELALRSASPDPVTRGYLESARTCTWDAAQTVRRVQAFARRRGKEPLDERLDLNDLVRQMVDVALLKGGSSARPGVVLPAIDIQAEGNAWVCGDATELRQVVTNLVFNALDAMPRGGTLTVRTHVTPTHVILAVRDTGTGISEAVRHRLFEPFFTTKGERGNGLGLSVVYGIVRRHGGDIRVESEVGRGSTFFVQLPAAAATAGGRGRAAVPGLPRPAAGTRVLVVEDQESISRFLVTLLTHLGCSARAEATGEDGVEALARERFDLVLTDLTLPGLSGREVAQAAARSAPGTPVVMLTGQADRLEAEGGLPEAVTRLLAKPVTLETLASTLAALCRTPADDKVTR
jgi:signal transduction histidine kinase/ActR/RegA family two-component response regulator